MTPTDTRTGACQATLKIRSDTLLTYGLYYEQPSNRPVFTANLVHEQQAWISLAVAQDNGLMVGAEAIVAKPGEPSSQTNPGIYDMKDYTPSGVTLMDEADENKPNPQTLFDHSVMQDDLETTMRFSRYLDEPHLLPIHLNRSTTFLFAVGFDNTFGIHKIKGSFRINLGTICADEDKPPATIELLTDGQESLWQIHGALASLAWAVATPLAVVTTQVKELFHGNKTWNWFRVHLYLNVASILMTLASFAIAVFVFVRTNRPHFSRDQPHHTVGLAVFVLASAQVMGGFLRPHIDDKHPVTKQRRVWKILHRVVGVALLAMGFYQIYSGMSLYVTKYNLEKNYSWIFWVWLALLTTVTVWERRVLGSSRNRKTGSTSSEGTTADIVVTMTTMTAVNTDIPMQTQ